MSWTDPVSARPAGADVDLVVVGAGPAGLAATVRACAAGLRVALVDSAGHVGGQFWRRPPQGSDPGLDDPDLHHDLRRYEALVRDLRAHERTGRARVLLRHEAWTVERDGGDWRVALVDRRAAPTERAATVTGARLLLATGAHERVLPFPGWDLPGVFTVGALQALLKGSSVLAGRRVVLGGTGPFLLPVATALAGRGADVVVCEAASGSGWLREGGAVLGARSKVGEAIGFGAALARHRVPVHRRHAVLAAHGRDRVDSATIARLDDSGRVVPGSEHRIAVDTVGTGWGFTPSLDLAQPLGCALRRGADGQWVVEVDSLQRTSVDGLLAAGETCGVGGADLAVAEGRLAALGVLVDLARTIDRRELTGLRREITDLRRFADAMHRAHPVPAGWPTWLTDDTLVCRCEEVTVSGLRSAGEQAEPRVDARTAKHLTRVGMGWCQGRMCGEAVRALCADEASLPPERLVAGPVRLGTLAGLDPASPGGEPTSDM